MIVKIIFINNLNIHIYSTCMFFVKTTHNLSSISGASRVKFASFMITSREDTLKGLAQVYNHKKIGDFILA